MWHYHQVQNLPPRDMEVLDRFMIDSMWKMSGNNRFHAKILPSPITLPLEAWIWSKVRGVTIFQGYLIFGTFKAGKLLLSLRDRALTKDLLEYGIWEPFETEVIKRFAKGTHTALDIGANIGHHSIVLGSLSKEVFAFEPETINFGILSYNVKANRLMNVRCLRKAVSDKAGILTLYLEPNNLGAHNIWDKKCRDRVDVESASLDEFFNEKHSRIEFVKMDIQGAEWLALKGMERVLKENRVVTIVSEFWPHGIDMTGGKPSGYLKSLLDLGFTLRELNETNRTLEPIPEVDLEGYASGVVHTNLLCQRSG